MKKIEHLGIAVKDLEASKLLFEKLLNTPCYKEEKVDSEKVTTAFFRNGPNKIELLAPIGGEGPIQKYLDKKGEGIHHIAIAVDDIYKEKERLENEGFVCLNDEPKEGADDKLICFFHPKSTNGVLIELCMDKQ
jgi:methylmalonyl-CoA/ethylmalonyl-CoA epimerase